MNLISKVQKFNLVEWLFIIAALSVVLSLVASGFWAVFLPILLPIVLCKLNRKVLWIYLSAYVLAYCILSAKGDYDNVIPGGGVTWFPYGFKNTHRDRPGGRIKTEHPTTLGWLFWPLWSLDTWLVHNHES